MYFTSALMFAWMAVPALAHIEIKFPPPINSKFDPQTPGSSIDYSMTSPLFADGSNYPCKGYNTPEAYQRLHSVDTLVAGSDYTVTLTGTATHEGGSCQMSVSYDQGKTFAVIASIIGGCLTGSGTSIKFPIPADLPSASKATLMWTWQNKVGNREMYGNCAVIDVTGSSSSSFTGPVPFRVNTFPDGTCINTEGQDMVYPNPGPSVQYFGSETASSAHTVIENCNFDEDADVTISPSGSPPVQPPKTSSRTASQSQTLAQTSTYAPPMAPLTTTAVEANAVHSVTTVKEPLGGGLIVTTSTHAAVTSSTMSPSLPPVHESDSVASDGQSNGTSSSKVAGQAYLRCDSLTTFSLCGGPQGCQAMGSVAAGTQCRDGTIVHATTRHKRMTGTLVDIKKSARRHIEVRRRTVRN